LFVLYGNLFIQMSLVFSKLITSSIVFFLFGNTAMAQDSILKQSSKVYANSKWKMAVVNGLGVSTIKESDGKWEGEWHIPEVSYSTELSFSRKIRSQIWLETGISFEYYRFRSKAYVRSGTGVFYTQGLNGLTPHTYSFTDDFARYSERESEYLSIPLSLEYSSNKRIGIYAKFGMRLSFQVRTSINNRRADNNQPIYGAYDFNPIGNSSKAVLFGSYAFGLQVKSGKTMGLLGLRYNQGFSRKQNGIRISHPQALRLEVGVQGYLTKDYSKRKDRSIDVLPSKKREYVYLELLGNKLFYSLNFEHSVVSREWFRWNLRVGGSLHKRGEVFDRLGLTGTSFVIGKMHGLELGFNMQFYQNGDLQKDFAYAPVLGYRFEPEGIFFGRVVYTPVYYNSLKYVCPFPSCSEKYGAVSIGVRF